MTNTFRGAAVKVLAVFGLLALLLTAFSVATVDATGQYPTGPDANQPENWEDVFEHPAQCYKHEAGQNSAHGSYSRDGKTFTLNAFNQDWPGDHWEAIIVSAGKLRAADRNQVTVHPAAGTYQWSGGEKGISHVIVCKGKKPKPTPTPVPTPTATPTPVPMDTPTPDPTPSQPAPSQPEASQSQPDVTPTPSASESIPASVQPTPTPRPSEPVTSQPASPSPSPFLPNTAAGEGETTGVTMTVGSLIFFVISILLIGFLLGMFATSYLIEKAIKNVEEMF